MRHNRIGMHRPFPALRQLNDYKHDCIESGTDIEYFHCYEDREKIHNAVFNVIATHLDKIRIYCLVVEKAKSTRLYRKIAAFTHGCWVTC